MDKLLEQLELSDAANDLAMLFRALPEKYVFQHAGDVLASADPALATTLIRSVDKAFLDLSDRQPVILLLLSAFESVTDAITFDAAVQLTLNHYSGWSVSEAQSFHSLLTQRYVDNLLQGDQFVARSALEGTVMLSILRSDKRLLLAAVNILVNSFPPSPVDREVIAYLPIYATKLLGLCYDDEPVSVVAEKVEELTGDLNLSVAAEAQVQLGLIRLHKAFGAESASELLVELGAARDIFRASASLDDSRTDSELLSAVLDVYVNALNETHITNQREAVSIAQGIVFERYLVNSPLGLPSTGQLELQLVGLVTHLERWVYELGNVRRIPNLLPSISVLAKLCTEITKVSSARGLSGVAAQRAYDMVLIPQLRSQYIRTQDLIPKLLSVLSDEQWRASVPAAEIAFCEMALVELQAAMANAPKEPAAVRLEQWRTVAERVDPSLATIMDRLRNQGQATEDVVIELLHVLIDEKRSTQLAYLSEGPTARLLEHLWNGIRAVLEPARDEYRTKCLLSAVRHVTDYFVRLYNADLGDANFLFAEAIGGVGKGASERNLENHFYGSKRYDPDFSLRKQDSLVVPGRVDLSITYYRDLAFTIEVKCEDRDISQEYIRRKYLTQAQSYAAATDGSFGFLFVLDTTPKRIGEPLRPPADYCYLDFRRADGAQTQTRVLVFIFPANRYRPSDHSNLPDGLKR